MKTRTYSPTPANLRRLARQLREGNLVAIPTETVYGLAADALNPAACRKIFAAKRRPAHDPLIVHVLDLAHAEQLGRFNPVARQLAQHYWPGPLTIIVPKQDCIPGIVTSGGETVALRSPAHPLTRRLLRLAGIPLAAPSANVFGYVSPTSAAHVVDGLGGRIPAVLDGGSARVGVESTIVDLTKPARPRVLRPGAITAEALAQFLGRPVATGVGKRTGRKPSRGMIAPGLLTQHYSPRTPLRLKADWSVLPAGVGAIRLQRPAGRTPAAVHWFSRNASLKEIARNLYRVLREADRAGYREIWVESLRGESTGLSAAIVDRLKRAAAKH